MVRLPVGGKSLIICLLISIQYTNVTDRRTDRRTPHDSNCRAYAGNARQKLKSVFSFYRATRVRSADYAVARCQILVFVITVSVS